MTFTPIRTKEDFLVFGSPCIEQDEIKEVIDSMNSGWLGTGPKVAQFEKDFAFYKKSQFATAVNSCSAALHLALLVSGIEPGDEVITTPLTFCATINAIIHLGATPVLADVDRETMNIDPLQVRKKITPRTKAILPVHFAGRPCDMEKLQSIAQINNLILIEDCAHAIETLYKGRPAGTFGEFGCFSFYVTKNVVTGEGGMVLTASEQNAKRLRVLGLHGMSHDAWKRFSDKGFKHYSVVEAGWKYNMMDLQAAIGIHQLKRVDINWKRREDIWYKYNNALAGLPVVCPAEPEPETRHGYHLYTILIDEEKAGISRDAFLSAMHQHNIGTGVHYLSIAEYPFYQKMLCLGPEDTANATQIGRQTVSLPLSAKLTDQDVNDVIQAVHDILDGKN